MKVFLKYFSIPLATAVIASVLFLIDAFIGGLFVEGGSFMWLAFVVWTVFYGATLKDRVKGLIGIVVGFLAAVVMMTITGSFTLNVSVISISSLLGVFVVNFAVMFMDKCDKIWLSSLSGAFVGISMTFSGFGVGLSPMTNASTAFMMLGMLLIYSILGLICGFCSTVITNKSKKRLAELNGEKTEETPVETKEEK